MFGGPSMGAAMDLPVTVAGGSGGSCLKWEHQRQERSRYSTLVAAAVCLVLVLHYARTSDGLPIDSYQTDPSTSFSEIVHPRVIRGEDVVHRHRRTSNASFDHAAEVHRRHYVFNTTDDSFHLRLTINHALVSRDFLVETRRSSNVAESHVKDGYARHHQCVYHGDLVGRSHSRVAINVCRGLSGVITLGEKIFFIEPVNASNHVNDDDDDVAQPHVLYQSPGKRHQDILDNVRSFCQSQDESGYTSGGSSRNGKRSPARSQRSVSVDRAVETLVVVDPSMMEYHKDQDVETYVLTIMNLVSSFYNDPSIGNSINIVLVRLIMLEEEQDDLRISHHADNTLDSFCSWQERNNPEGDDNPLHHDNAILLTRKDLCLGHDEPCSTLGLAHVSGMCNSERSCSVNEDNGLALGFTVAHEMGHNFGMQHDGAGNTCPSYDENSPHVMSSRVIGGFTPVTWSTCSRDYITQFLDGGQGYCLEDQPALSRYTFPHVLPGVMYSADHQCRLQYGPNATVCPMFESDLCTTLWCSVDRMCQSRMSGAARGTHCGKDKWCVSGKCVDLDDEPVVINGGWGPWGEWSACSLTCGTAVKSRERQCNNPRPSKGGKYCVGERKKYALCMLEDCPVGSPSVRATQCRAFNTLRNDGVNQNWVATHVQGKPCELYCRRRDSSIPERLSPRVLDGTPCLRFSRDICIDGICQSVGCDNKVNSAAVEDRCGVCHGDGSECQTVRGSFTQPSGKGYIEAVVIPAGARNIIIEETGAEGNYIAVRDDSGRYLLNGDWMIEWSGEYEMTGTMVSYERIGEKERLEARGPTNAPLYIMLLFRIGEPGMTYEYTVPRNTTQTSLHLQSFSWVYNEWTPCSASCGVGFQQSRVICSELLAGKVDSAYCEREGEKPEDMQRTCNENVCPAIWWVGPWQLCSVSCGEGGRVQRSVFCTRVTTRGEQMVLDDADCADQGLGKPVTNKQCENPSPCQATTTSRWQTGEWSQCSATCGDGWHTRSVTCIPTNGSCDDSFKPSGSRPCFHQQCISRQNDDHRRGESRRNHEDRSDSEAWVSSSFDEYSMAGMVASSSGSSSSYSIDYPVNFGEWEKRLAAKKHGTAANVSSSSTPATITNFSPSPPSDDGEEYNDKHEQEIMTDTTQRNEVPVKFSPINFPSLEKFSHTGNSSGRQQSNSGGGVETASQGQSIIITVEWFARQWQSCSATCGYGTEWRLVECVDAVTGQVAEGCEPVTRPIHFRPCHIRKCPEDCIDTLSTTMCQLVAQSGNCADANFRDRCCVTCSIHR